jgi:Sulfotransferase family
MMAAVRDAFDGRQLIFLVSQPRSGSTLLQHILASHPQVHTLPEPWLMLHLVYGLRERGLSAEYNARYAYSALKGFLSEIQADEDQYWRAVRAAASHLYEPALQGTGKAFFLDKTPRYYFILPELRRIFPKARFVLLVRNPLAVFASILNVNFKGELRGFLSEDRRHDILTAPRLMFEAIKDPTGMTAIVHYEALATHPDETARKLCEQIALDYDPAMLNYAKVRLAGTFVDPKSIYEHSGPVHDYIANWPDYLDRPGKVRTARAYLKLLGAEIVDGLGYSYRDIERVLDRLPAHRRMFEVPWGRLLAVGCRLSGWDRFILSLLGTFGHRNSRRVLHHYRRKFVGPPDS